MEGRATVAVVQPVWKRYRDEGALRDEVARHLRLARDKGAALALFPEGMGELLAGPLAEQEGATLRKQGLVERLVGGLRGGPPLHELIPLLRDQCSELWTARYVALWGELAREFQLAVVGGTLLARDEQGTLRHRAALFAADGTLLGWQSQLHSAPGEAGPEPDDALHTFDLPWGRVGLLVGHDLLFPELARALAYRGAVALLCPSRTHSAEGWRRLRLVAAARAQENQLFVAQSFGVGEGAPWGTEPLVGRSALFAPVELSPRRDGLLAEVGAESAPGVASAEWPIAALRNLWESAELPLRTMGRGALYQGLLAFDYRSGATIAERTADIEEIATLPAPPDGALALAAPRSTRSLPSVDPESGLYLGEQPPPSAAAPSQEAPEGQRPPGAETTFF